MSPAELRGLFGSYPDLSKKASMEAYMKNRFVFAGLPNPVRKALQKEFTDYWKQRSEAEVRIVVYELWQMPERELRYTAIELLYAIRRKWTQETLEFIEYAIGTDAWWDTVDSLAGKCAGVYFQSFPGFKAQTLERWIASPDFWFNRSAILHQLAYKKQTDTGWLEKSILPHTGSGEFFLQKAIGWALRQYARTDALWVTRFCDRHTLKSLSRREALKHL